MRLLLLRLLWGFHILHLGATTPTQQQPLLPQPPDSLQEKGHKVVADRKKLHGRFLHITDLHPDPFYKPYTSTDEEAACHWGQGPAGKLGAETTDCDSPLSLINATFEWVDKHLKDTIDFIVWTGDSARHDNDEEIPRDEDQVVELNKLLVEKFFEVFGKEDDDEDPTNDFIIPIIPNIGNNDILPHNIFNPGPNRWTRKYTNIWRQLIPEEQRHVFERGGYFFVEAITNKLAIFSLNTLYFFKSNTAVDGCARKSEPGYEQMEWLRIQLELMRRRGLKAILTGHVPPARTKNRSSWDETCWHKYTYWMHQYRDVVVAGLYGHMNMDHFMLQDAKEVDHRVMDGQVEALQRTALDEEVSIQSSAEYLSDLRHSWRKIPNTQGIDFSKAGESRNDDERQESRRKKKKQQKKTKEEKFFSKIGGEWGERYSLTLVGGSVVPNYFPSLRVFEYNITGLNGAHSAAEDPTDVQTIDNDNAQTPIPDDPQSDSSRPRRPSKPRFPTPLPTSAHTPPGPAYSAQPFTLLGYTQYYANLTTINSDFDSDSDDQQAPETDPQPIVDASRWHKGKHSGKRPRPKKFHRKFSYEVEYDTRSKSDAFGLADLTVRELVGLAGKLGRYKPSNKEGDYWAASEVVELESRPRGAEEGEVVGVEKKGKKKRDKKKKEKKRRRKELRELWFTFVRRAYIGSKDEEELRETFG